MIDLPTGICYATYALSGLYLTTCCKELMVSGFGCQVSVKKNHKYQITNTKWFDKLTTSPP
jgi:hypothetical protein